MKDDPVKTNYRKNIFLFLLGFISFPFIWPIIFHIMPMPILKVINDLYLDYNILLLKFGIWIGYLNQ